jgi:hypothetical protein
MSNDYRAKRHTVLDNLKKDLSKGFIEQEVAVLNTKFKLRSLNEDAESWADGFVRSSSPLAMVNSRKAPRLAVAIQTVDGVSLDQLFMYPDDMPEKAKQALDENPIAKRYWLWEQMLYFLSEDAGRPFVNELYDALARMDESRDQSLEKIPNS